MRFVAFAVCPRKAWGRGRSSSTPLAGSTRRRATRRPHRPITTRAPVHSPDYCFPARLEEIAVLEAAIRANSQDGRACYYLGNLLYDRRRHEEAIRLWARSVKIEPSLAVAWRNLGIGYFNVAKKPDKARAAYERAFRAEPASARLLFERDQLWKRLGVIAEEAAAAVAEAPGPGRPARRFERGTVRALEPDRPARRGPGGRLRPKLPALGRRRRGSPWGSSCGASWHWAVRPWSTTSRKRRPSTSAPPLIRRGTWARRSTCWPTRATSIIGLAVRLGRAGREAPRPASNGERPQPSRAISRRCGPAGSRKRPTIRRLAWRQLGRDAKAEKLLKSLLAYARELETSPAKIDYFATSLPTMLLFDDDLQQRQKTTALFLRAQAHLGLGEKAKARRLVEEGAACAIRTTPWRPICWKRHEGRRPCRRSGASPIRTGFCPAAGSCWDSRCWRNCSPCRTAFGIDRGGLVD